MTVHQYDGQMMDVTGANEVHIQIRHDEKVVWVNVDGICRLRICRINENVTIEDSRPNDKVKQIAKTICLQRVDAAGPDGCGEGSIGYYAINEPGGCPECIQLATQIIEGNGSNESKEPVEQV